MGKKKSKASVGDVAGVVLITVQPDGSFGVDIESDLSPEVLGATLRTAADTIEGKVDRAAGAWGR